MEDFEKDMRKYFQERKIQPSKNVWNKMEALLERQQEQRSRWYILPIAVSVVLLLGLVQFFRNSQSLPIEQNKPNVFVTNDSIFTVGKSNESHEIVAEQTANKHSIINKKNQAAITSSNISEKSIIVEKEIQKEKVVVENNDVKSKVTREMEEAFLTITYPSVEVAVNPKRLLQSAEIERHIENTITKGQNFWNKFGEKHSLAQNY